MRAVVGWGGLGSRAGFLSTSWGFDPPPLHFPYLDFTRFRGAFLGLDGGVSNRRFTTSSKGTDLRGLLADLRLSACIHLCRINHAIPLLITPNTECEFQLRFSFFASRTL